MRGKKPPVFFRVSLFYINICYILYIYDNIYIRRELNLYVQTLIINVNKGRRELALLGLSFFFICSW